MKRSLMRPTAALFPLVLLAASLFGNRTTTINLFFYYCLIQLHSLCSIDSFRNAAAREPGIKRVDRRFSGAWPMIIIGIVVSVVVEYFIGFEPDEIMLVIAAGCIIIEQLFEERMHALSHPSDGAILSMISNVLLLAGLMIDAGKGIISPIHISGFYTVCGASLGMMISIVTSYVIEPMHAFSLLPRNIGYFPKAAIQTLLYPVLLLIVFHESMIVGFVFWRLSRTVCRRAQDESRPLNLLLITAVGAAIIAGMYGLSMDYPVAIFLALICSAIVFCAPSWRFYGGIALITAAISVLTSGIEQGIVFNVGIIACVVISIILNLHKAFLRKV